MPSHNDAPNQFIEADGVRFAYRRFGSPGRTPVLLLQHFIGTMDWWDPSLTNGLAKDREVILFDNRGVGLSSGLTPNHIDLMAEDVHTFIQALKLAPVDVLAFSIGGMIGQELALNHPDDVRKLILVGTGPKGGVGMQDPRPEVVQAFSDAGPDPKVARPFIFFSQSQAGQSAAGQFMARTAERTIDLDPYSSAQTMGAQSEALAEFGAANARAEFMVRLSGLTQPALVVSGDNDIMVDTANSYMLAQAIPRAQLIVYPDSGHGALFQYAPLFVEHVNLFLDRTDL